MTCQESAGGIAISRLIANSGRLDTFINAPGNEAAYITSTGQHVETLPNFMARIKISYLKPYYRGVWTSGMKLLFNEIVKDPDSCSYWLAVEDFTTSGSLAADLADGKMVFWSASEAHGIAYYPDYTGSEVRTVADKLDDMASVKDFGAKGDGISDDTAALRRAFLRGGLIYIPDGDYLIKGKGANAGGVEVSMTRSLRVLCSANARFIAQDLDTG